jgi:hypothetical protein
MGTVKSLAQAFALSEALKILKASIAPGAAIWKRRIRYEWQTALKRPVLVELLPSLELRVTDGKTGDVITQGQAWVDGGGHIHSS